MASRPTIKPWLRPFARRSGEVQFGVLPDGVIVSGVSPAEVRLLAGLDGSLTRNGSFAVAAAQGVSARRWRHLLDLLSAQDLLVPEGIGSETGAPAHRGEHVLVDGTGDLSDSIAALLLETGVRVTHGRPATDVVLADPGQDRPALAVLVGTDIIDPRRGDIWLAHSTPALSVVVSGPTASVGPVLEARPGAPCLWCLHRHRADRDSEWPTLMAQLLPADRPVVAAPAPDPAPEPVLAQLVACTVALFAGLLLAGAGPSPGVSVDLCAPWPRMDHRRWTQHARCPHHPGVSVVA